MKQSLLSGRYWPWVFLFPCLLGTSLFILLPVCLSFALSFCDWDLLGQPHGVGLSNYLNVLQSQLFWKTLGNTLYFASFSVALELLCAMGIALALFRLTRGLTVFRTLFFLPVMTPMVAVALVWGWLVDPQQGLLNHLLGQPIPWLYQSHTAMPVLILLRSWKEMGYTMLLLLAGLQSIPASLLEAAQIDGASPWQQFRYVLLPGLGPTLFFLMTVCSIQALQAFDSVYLLTQGGPDHSTQVMVFTIFQEAFQFYRIGPASAMAYLLFALILGLTLLQWQVQQRRTV